MLSKYISLKRRYSRSVNLERDLDISDSVLGYVPTTRSIDMFERFMSSFTTPRSVRAWTITGIYGSGKSSFAHFLASLCAPSHEQIKTNALKIIDVGSYSNNSLHSNFKNSFPKSGLVRAVATAQQEPASNTVIRALSFGTSLFWRKTNKKNLILKKLASLTADIANGHKVDNQTAITMLKEVAQASGTGVLLIIDELGKNLEFAAQSQGVDDLFLLQQIAEMSAGEKDSKIFMLGLLHQSFSDYAHGLTIAQRNEWGKIQGRFEDVPFAESSEQMIKLIGNAIDQTKSVNIQSNIRFWAQNWQDKLKDKIKVDKTWTKIDILNSLYPLHPLSAFVLPILCSRYAQNDRSLFTFLTSSEPYSLACFLNEIPFDEKNIPTLKLHRIYDYFVESAGMSISSRPQMQRWLEIHGRISDAKHIEFDALLALKTIGILNLVSLSGALKASRSLVVLALCDSPNSQAQQEHWNKVIDTLLEKGFITWRKQLDEIRIWEGTDFDVEQAIHEQIESGEKALANLLSEFCPSRPLVAQRHSYQTGTLRYFEREYIDKSHKIENVTCKNKDSDGLIVYWIDDKKLLKKFPKKTKDEKPLIVICADKFNGLQEACLEFTALKKIEKNASQLQLDGVARREVHQRLIQTKKLVDESLSHVFSVTGDNITCWVLGKEQSFKNQLDLNACLSDVCDQVYKKSLRLWNELINRRELTSQGSKARRELIEAMLQNGDKKRLGLEGNGPECSMYESLLKKTGVHTNKENIWCFSTPSKNSGVLDIWSAIEKFCLSANASPQAINVLYDILSAPPYGTKEGVIPVLFVAVILKHTEDISVYYDGTFIAMLGPEHFELLVKRPERFAVKHFEITGLRIQVFKELESIFKKSQDKHNKQTRNATLLGIVKPLIQFVKSLPSYSINTSNLSKKAMAVRKALLNAKEPDQLLFKNLPF